jgi:hypothetical protein
MPSLEFSEKSTQFNVVKKGLTLTMNRLPAFCRQSSAAPPDAMLTESVSVAFGPAKRTVTSICHHNGDVNIFLVPGYACVRQGKSAERYFYRIILIKVTIQSLLPYGQHLTNHLERGKGC